MGSFFCSPTMVCTANSVSGNISLFVFPLHEASLEIKLCKSNFFILHIKISSFSYQIFSSFQLYYYYYHYSRYPEFGWEWLLLVLDIVDINSRSFPELSIIDLHCKSKTSSLNTSKSVTSFSPVSLMLGWSSAVVTFLWEYFSWLLVTSLSISDLDYLINNRYFLSSFWLTALFHFQVILYTVSKIPFLKVFFKRFI